MKSSRNKRICANVSKYNKVSVIVPTFNRERYLPLTIESILNQTYDNYEIIIVDDGSTDNTNKIVDKYKKEYPKKIRYFYKANGGCAEASNYGIKYATGAYICILGDDDLYEPKKLEQQVKMLDEDPTADFVYSDSYLFYNNDVKDLQISRIPIITGKFSYDHFFSTNVFIPAMLFKRRIFEELSFDDNLRYNEDSDFTLRVSILYKGLYSDYPSLKIRKHEKQKSANRLGITEALMRSYENILKKYGEQYIRIIGEKGINERMRGIYLEYIKECIINNEYDKASQILIKINEPPLFVKLCIITRNNKLLELSILLNKIVTRINLLNTDFRRRFNRHFGIRI